MPIFNIVNSNNEVINSVVAKNAEEASYNIPEDAHVFIPEPVEISTQEPPAPEPRTWESHDVRNGMTLSERVIWDNNSHNAVTTAKIEMSSPKELAETTAVLDLLVDSQIISEDTKATILA
jgi:hypothetical protein